MLLDHSFVECSLTQFDFSRDGQLASYTRDGATWHQIDFSAWSTFIQTIISKIEDAVSNQLPTNMRISDLVNLPIVDDLTDMPPHMQLQNSEWMEDKFRTFKAAMQSPNESRHRLFANGGAVAQIDHIDAVNKYVESDQAVRGLLAVLKAISSGVPLRAFQFRSVVHNISNNPEVTRNVWVVNGRFIIGKPKAKQRGVTFSDTMFWLPRPVTGALATLFFFQQRLISELLHDIGWENHLYGTHIWPLPPQENSNATAWNGTDINRSIKGHSKAIIKLAVDAGLIRQMAEGLLRDKIPVLFEVFHERSNQHLTLLGITCTRSTCVSRPPPIHAVFSFITSLSYISFHIE
ncbi:hypothetical protein BD779DRAFT_1678175 [Infundibulicybe gibba]|nr:hypothetical protein BD779DRAFT_1678175 [Infundibulicybe gibba]